MPRAAGSLNKKTVQRIELQREAMRAAILREREDEARRLGIDTIPAKPVAPDVQGIDGLRKTLVLAENMVAVLRPSPGWVKDEATGKVTNSNPYYDPKQFDKWHERFMTVSDKLAAYQTPKLAAVAVGEHRRVEVVVLGGLPKRLEAPLIEGRAEPVSDSPPT